MTKRKYCLVLNFVEWLFLCISLLYFYLYNPVPMIIIAVLTTGFAVLMIYAMCFLHNGQDYLLLHICIVGTTATLLTFWIISLVFFEDFFAIFPALISLLPVCAYFLGLKIKKQTNNTPAFHYKATIFFSIILFLSGCMPVSHEFPNASTYAVMPLSVSYFSFIAAVIGFLVYFLFYTGRLSVKISFVLVGLNSSISIVAIILNTINWEIFLLIGSLLVLGFLTAGYYCIALSKKGNELFLDHNKELSITQKQYDENWIKQLEDLYKLYEMGILTEEEYQTQKDKIWGGK